MTQAAVAIPPERRTFFNSTALSSQRTGWGTPREFFDVLCRYAAGLPPDAPPESLPRPWVDPCAVATNALVPHFYSPADNGLLKTWRPPAEAPRFVIYNPPYGSPEEACHPRKCKKKRCKKRGFCLADRLPGIADWVEKGRAEAELWQMQVHGIFPRRGADWWGRMLSPPPLMAGEMLGLGLALPGALSPFQPYWPTLEWRLFRYERLAVEVIELDGRLSFIPEVGATKATTGEPQTGDDSAGFDSAVVIFHGGEPSALIDRLTRLGVPGIAQLQGRR